MEPELIVGPAAQGQSQIGAVGEGVPQPAQAQRAGLVGLIRNERGDQALAVSDDIRPFEMAFRLAPSFFAKRKQSAQARIGGAIRRIDQDRQSVRQIEAAADDEAYACGFRRLMGAHDPGKRVAVDDRQGLDAEQRSLGEQLLAGGRAPQEAEMRGDLQLGVAGRAGHPKIPCRNQRCDPVAESSPSPERKIQ